MFGLITKSQIKRILIQLKKEDHRGLTGSRENDFYYSQGVGNAVSYICHRLGLRYEDIALAAREGNSDGRN